MAYSLTNASGNSVITTFGTIKSENVKFVSNMVATPLYGTASSGAFVFDFGGAIRRITIEGEIIAAKTGAGNTLSKMARELDALVNGAQDPNAGYPLRYKSDTILNASDGQVEIRVKVEDTNWTIKEGRPRILEYTITLIESSTDG